MKKLTLMSVALLLAVPVLGGVVYEIEVTDHEQSPPRKESLQLSTEGRNLKMGIGTGGAGPGEMIFRGGDNPEMVVVDHDRKSYFVMTQEQAQQLAGQLDQVAAQMLEALKNVPEEQRKMVEQMMKRRMPKQAPSKPATELRKTSERDTKNGYPCVKYEVLKEGDKVGDLWVTEWKNIEGSDETQAVFGEMANFFQGMVDAFSSIGAPGGPGAEFDRSFLGPMKGLDGFPVVATSYDDDGSLADQSTLRSARRETLDPDAFEAPSGYERQDMSFGK